MRIGLIGHHVAPVTPPFLGGVEAMTWSLSHWLGQRGHDVTLFAPPGSAVPGVVVRELELHAPLGRLARSDVSMPPERFMDAHTAYQRLMIELMHDGDAFDVIHIHALHYLPVAMSELLPVPVALTLHTPPTPWLEASLRRSPDRRPYPVAVSDCVAQMWRGAAPISDVIHNGIDLDAWRLGLGGTQLVWCGRLVPEKAPHLAIQAARLSGRRLRLAGPIADPAYFREHVAPALDDGIRYVGHLSHDGLRELLGSSAALLQTPVWEEPFGLTAAEAMACGTPVAGFRRGGLTEFVDDGAGLLVGPDDVAGLAAAADSVTRLPRRRVREHAERVLSLERTGLAYERLYRRLIDAALAPAAALCDGDGPVPARA